MELRFEDISVQIGDIPIVAGITLRAVAGEVAGVIGPNGSGKSTLLRTAYRHLRPRAGAVFVGEDDAWRLTSRASALRVAAVPQERSAEFDYTVREMVAMGRLPHATLFGANTAESRSVVEGAMARVGVADLAERAFATLSGGERQRVLLARALAQQTPVLVLDEPTNHLDIRHQIELLTLLRELRLTTLIAVHDLNLAAAYCDRLHLMSGGRLVASGPPAEVLTPERIAEVFGVRAEVQIEPDGGLRLRFWPLRGV